jgi:serine phosphatase RsbU (regulator of sigma subunit)
MTPESDLHPSARFVCGEVRGGIDPAHERVELPGLEGVLYSHPCHGSSGGDVHFLSVCGSGLLARVCLADVAGHGETIASVGAEMHAHLRRSVDTIDEGRVLARLDRQLEAAGLDTMTTAALATYYPPRRRLTVSYAGHPPGWLYSAADRRWRRLDGPADEATRASRPVDLPLGTRLGPAYTRRHFPVATGDRFLLVTDGVLEATAPDGRVFGDSGVERILDDGGTAADSVGDLADRLLEALRTHAASHVLAHDDVTFFVAEIVPGPPGPAVWHVVKNRVLSRLVTSGPAPVTTRPSGV